jgi:hypothetical protein
VKKELAVFDLSQNGSFIDAQCNHARRTMVVAGKYEHSCKDI